MQHIWAHPGNLSGRGQDAGNTVWGLRGGRRIGCKGKDAVFLEDFKDKLLGKKNHKQQLKLQGKVKIYSLLHSQKYWVMQSQNPFKYITITLLGLLMKAC